MKHELADEISDNDYLRQRIAPHPGDPLYIHLSDLRNALELVRTNAPIRLLDFGCGGSPYRSLFPNADYVRADYLESPGLDHIVDETCRISEPDQSFDMVLSTQVLEHVTNPVDYLAEAFRLLKPGGQFICTTHGIYEDHGCPYDFWRWTGYGLAKLCSENKLNVEKVARLSTGPRAILFFSELYRTRFHKFSNDSVGQSLFTYLNTIHSDQAQFHRACDALYPEHRVVESEAREHAFYVGLLVVARKTSSPVAHDLFKFTRHSVS